MGDPNILPAILNNVWLIKVNNNNQNHFAKMPIFMKQCPHRFTVWWCYIGAHINQGAPSNDQVYALEVQMSSFAPGDTLTAIMA